MVFCLELQAGKFVCPYLLPSLTHSAFAQALPCFRRVFRENRAGTWEAERPRSTLSFAPFFLGSQKSFLSLISPFVETKLWPIILNCRVDVRCNNYVKTLTVVSDR